MPHAYNAVVVGGGVAGLMTAARLARAGWKVALLESSLLGAGATTANHGIVHNGAMYARWHPEIVTSCLMAHDAYATSFPSCVVANQPCWYVAKPKTLWEYEKAWRRHDLVYENVNPRELHELLNDPDTHDVQAATIEQHLIDTRALITDLAARCLVAGVDLKVGVAAHHVVRGPCGTVTGVETAQGLITAPIVVVCSGIGTRQLLERSGSRAATELTSRLEMMCAVPGDVPHPIIGLEFGWPALAPAAVSGTILASRYGGVQRFVQGGGRWPVPAAEMAELTREITQWVRPGLIDTTGAVAWVCSKTEHTAGTADQWGTEPNFSVLNHGARDDARGWWTVLPGKMTLALHASQQVTAEILGRAQPLHMSAHHGGRHDDVVELVSSTPWAAHAEGATR